MLRSLPLLVCVCALNASAGEETPEQRVELVLSLPHGLNRLSPDDRARVAQIVADPAAHLAALNRIFHPAWAPQSKTGHLRDEDAMRLERALSLAGEMKTAEADEFSAGWYLRLAPEQLVRGSLDTARATALLALGERRSDQVVEYVLSHLAWVGDVHRIQMLQYLAKACRGDQRVVAELRAIYGGKIIEYDDSLRRTIAWMEKS